MPIVTGRQNKSSETLNMSLCTSPVHTQGVGLFPTFLEFCGHLQTMRASSVCSHPFWDLPSYAAAVNPTLSVQGGAVLQASTPTFLPGFWAEPAAS